MCGNGPCTLEKNVYSTPLESMGRSFRQRINKETETLNDNLERLDLIDIYRAFHSKLVKYTVFSSVYRIFFNSSNAGPQGESW